MRHSCRPDADAQEILLNHIHRFSTNGPVSASLTSCINKLFWGFPGGPVVENPPCNAGDASSIPGLGTKVPYAEPPEPEGHN